MMNISTQIKEYHSQEQFRIKIEQQLKLLPVVQSNLQIKIESLMKCSLLKNQMKMTQEVNRILVDMKSDLKLSIELPYIKTSSVAEAE